MELNPFKKTVTQERTVVPLPPPQPMPQSWSPVTVRPTPQPPKPPPAALDLRKGTLVELMFEETQPKSDLTWYCVIAEEPKKDEVHPDPTCSTRVPASASPLTTYVLFQEPKEPAQSQGLTFQRIYSYRDIFVL